jgi:prenylcysteine alpha-carboxyl methylesterase
MCCCCSLALKLWSYLGLGWKWLVQVYRLVLYAMFLLPGFLQVRQVQQQQH